MSYIAALAIQALAFAVFLYRAKGKQGLSPDGRHYLAMASFFGAPAPFARRWLLPRIVGTNVRAWALVSGLAFLAVGPLTYALTGALWCVWLMAWLPGWTLSVRLPILTDQVALTLMIVAAVLEQGGCTWGACLVLVVAAQIKEPAGVFGALLCMNPWVAGAGLLGTACAVVVGKVHGTEAEDEYLLHPFRVAMAKHDPLDPVTMVLPWGGVVVVGIAAWQGLGTLELVAGMSLALGYGQLLIANDRARLYQWAAPAVLMAVAGYDGAWLVPALVLHPFVCGVAKRA